jgi:NAD(P)-dependent dehydrogenase (short-subunit alcohol dehydrogenase family)
MSDLADRVVIITGASRGLGAALAPGWRSAPAAPPGLAVVRRQLARHAAGCVAEALDRWGSEHHR